ncbi:MAG: MarR family winged helix-turn-helix transcriptional regulator [Mycobacterium sp.]|uniref:MarR family winged helix-turn-helix transcriptional regulator n=1 Tax=Mycobacterium sp. TaxID=1785 RepID=UPI003F988C71
MGDPRQLSTSAASPTPVHENTTDESNLADALRNELRQLRIELSIATRRVAAATGLNDSDLDVLDVLARYGAQSPTSLARRMGIHPATMTGVLTRLETAGWVVRRPDVSDRRSVQVEPSGFDRLTALYREANERLDEIAAQLTPEAGEVILDYLGRVCAAVHEASTRLAVGGSTR